jgi:2-oxo-4-hydroxy-4-carboxy-5-ureidoimidazoline decarboxylase
MTLQQLNALDQTDFVQLLGAIFEHSPWIAERAFAARPFESIADLHQKMFDVVKRASTEQQKQLILNHPELAGRAARAGELTRDSRQEQAGAGLNRCSADELARLQLLNARYREKFGFPFIVAVKGLTRCDIMNAMERRLLHSQAREFATSLDEIGNIALVRLQQLITG